MCREFCLYFGFSIIITAIKHNNNILSFLNIFLDFFVFSQIFFLECLSKVSLKSVATS